MTTPNPPMPHPVLALLGRYATVLQAAWQARRELAGPARLADERAFLPAAMSLQKTPPHPAPRRAALAICALFATALGWACIGEVDVVAVAPGRLIVGERTKLVQPLETAVVRAIHVRDGDLVQAGQLLVELDPTAPQADATRLAEERDAAQDDARRAQALLRADAGGAAKISPLLPPHPQAAAGRSEDPLLQSEWQDHQAKLAKLQAEHARREAELATAQQVLAKLQATVPLARKREADYQQLARDGFMSGHAGQDRTRERIEQERDLATAQARVQEAHAALAEAQRSQAAYRAEMRRTWQDRAAQARLKSTELTQEHAKARQRSTQTRLTAPVAGTVQQLAIHTSGGVVTPAQPLMVIVPEQEATEVIAEVTIDNKDIGFVQAGQTAQVKLETFNFTRYGTVPATVQWVTADAVVQPVAAAKDSDAETKPSQAASPAAMQAVFPARIALARGDMLIDGKAVRLAPGLNVTAEIKTGRRRVIDYLLSPVQQRVGESLRER